ncbi:XRE family transcriptional regulator [Nocardioides terrisoli]|uniref:XRE family transcriptional regulator n=1 Tax=Nocardioides terrisoli TaxID=3388267 RepID=UPI00287B8B39|nr:XRE family transcriptional regulator [Nocardioides marmorisolisilvae]
MSNERLRSQIAAAGLDYTTMAGSLEIDPKTVERWVTTDRLPHRRHRWAAAELLGVDEGYLWPRVVDDPRTKSASQAEFVALYPHRGAIPAELWDALLRDTHDSFDLLAYSGLFLFDAHPDVLSSLIAKAGHGLKARIALGDPDSEALRQRGEEEGIGDNMAARVRVTLDALAPLREVHGIELRTHSTPLYTSIYRFDEQLLVNTHTYGSSAAHNPVLHLHRVPGGRLFDHYMQAFDRVWATTGGQHDSPAMAR